ncbi:MAG: hypothetical protein AB8G23_09885 [Myxococcota bacterium]
MTMTIDGDRKPVWSALSELWLDTELEAYDHARIAEVLAESPFSTAELKEIEGFEVAPVLWPNLASVAGEWAGWNDEELHQKCAQQQAFGRGSVRRIRTWLVRRFARHTTSTDWNEIEQRIDKLRASK